MPDPDRKTISATESPALLGASPYLTRWMLWQRFANGIEPERETNNRMEWGTKLQVPIMEVVAKDRLMKVGNNALQLYRSRGLLGCTPDATIYCPERGPGALEIKCVFDYQSWGKRWDGGKTVPRDIEIQIQQQMFVGDGDKSYRWGLIAVWVCADLFYFERKSIPELWEKLGDEAAAFFADVVCRKEPDLAGVAVELPLMQQLFPTRPESVLDLSDDDLHKGTAAAVALLKNLKEKKDDATRVCEELRARFLALARDNERVILPNGVSYRVKKSGRGKTIDPIIPEGA